MSETKRSKILVVEDQENWRDVFSSILKTDHDVILAASYDEAIQVLDAENSMIDLMVVDISLEVGIMTDEGGLRLLQYVTQQQYPFGTIVVTGYPSLKTVRKALRDYLACDYVEKYPEGGFNIVEFRDTVKQCIHGTCDPSRSS